ncbi:hypothetical protein BBJ28_00017663 [Nothophytophthora sp. Chile5]|nr:hypothetical protein BBJ28_00017663 [Nothophytophthora sp. Chile5]
MRGPPGRPRFIGGGMTREDPASSDFFDPNNLLRILTAQPGRAVRWPFAQEFDVDEGSSTIREHRVGQVVGCRMSDTDGVFEWSVSFLHGDHGDTLYYQVEELVTGLILARTMGAA